MELGAVTEIAVLTKVRHHHVVAFLGHCLYGNERLLVYELMPRGPIAGICSTGRRRD